MLHLRNLAIGVVWFTAIVLPAAAAAQSQPDLCVRYGKTKLDAVPECGSSGSGVQVTVGTSPSGPSFSVDGTTYTSAQTFTWTVGDTHTIAVTSPQTSSGTEYTFSSWSDGGALSHTVTASSSTSSYTASFSTSYQLDIAANNSSHGTFTPASGSYYAAGSVVSIEATPTSGYSFDDWTGSSDVASTTSASTTITMNSAESITANFKSSGGGIQYFGGTVNLVVTTAADDDTPNAANCPAGGPTANTGLNCSLRDALAAAGAGQTDISFSSSVFSASNTAAENTITLQSGNLQIPSDTTINGLITPSNANQPNVVTIDGGQQFTVFWIGSGQIGVELDNLNITDGYNTFGGGAIYNDGELTVSNCMIDGNVAPGGEGGGIFNDIDGTLTLTTSTVAGNSASTGGGIVSYGVLAIAESTISGNQATTSGGGVALNGKGTIASSTVSGNQVGSGGSGGGIVVAPAKVLTLTNSIVSGNSSPYSYADVQGLYTDGGGNVVGQSGIELAPLGYYGGPTETQVPMPGSPAICAALAANISGAIGWDQRGLPNENTGYAGYSATLPCVDAGAVQTSYSLSFSGNPAPIAPNTSIFIDTNFTAAVTLEESGQPFTPAVSIPLSLTGNGTLTGGSAMTASGVANYSTLEVNATGTGDVLMASLTLNPAITPTPPSIANSSAGFNVTSLATTTSAMNANAAFSGSALSIPLMATVSSSQTVSAGTVTFTVMNGSSPIGSPVASAALSAGTASVNYLLPAATPPGTYSIEAAYNGGGAFTASSDTSHTLTIAQAASAVAVTASTGNANLDASVTFTAMVTGTASVAPSGTVTFYDGATVLGSGAVAQGAAMYSTKSLTAGAHLITAVYSGDTNFAGSTSAQYVETVTAPDYSLTANPTSLSLNAGQTGTVIFTFAPVGGYTGTVNFACSGMPTHASCSFSPASLTAAGDNAKQTTTMTITTMGSNTGTVADGRAPLSGKPIALLARISAIPALFFGLLLGWQRRRLRWAARVMVAVLSAVILLGLSACGGSSSSTAAGTYSVVITASAGTGGGSSAHTVTFALTISE